MHASQHRGPLGCESLELRALPSSAVLAAGTLTITGTGTDRIRIVQQGDNLRVLDGTEELGQFASAAVTSIAVDAGAGNDTVIVANNVLQPVTMNGDGGNDKLVAGAGAAALFGGAGNDELIGGLGGTSFNGDGGANDLLRVQTTDPIAAGAADRILLETQPAAPLPEQTISASEVDTLLKRAAAASSSTDAIIAIVDRNGRILGVRVESGVSPGITGNTSQLIFAIDGAVAKARTGAFFANNQAPLTSRTVQFISQSTITEREVNSNPNITDPNSTVRGPGFVAPVGIGGHFPPNVQNTPQVDLYEIEHTNRDGTFAPGPDGIKGTADDVQLPERFNLNPAFVPPGEELTPPDSYGVESGLAPRVNGKPVAQSRGIATLPGGIPIYKNGQVVGGIGVFFPGRTGYATEENSSLSTTFDPTKPDRSLEAEWMAFAAVGGFQSEIGGAKLFPIGDVGGVALPAGFGLPNGRIDLVGITLDIVGPGGAAGLDLIAQVGAGVGRGNPNDGANQEINPGPDG
ncbi:MAG TPA: hypothetical protein VLM40_21545, partial [Gemmata sp.]|nr:hypothetical protein [Gemmata sp.]